jgi:APA family basic amino acid/polyamine antiporter
MGTSIVIILYFLANVAYIQVLGVDKIAAADNKRLGSVMMEAIFGNNGRYFMAAMIMISTFGCLNGLIFTAARVYYAMAKDGLFFKQAGTLNKNDVPAKSLTMQYIWACLLCFSGTYGKLLDYVMFAVMIFYVLTVTGLFVLRIKKPDMPRPYKAFGYPLLPAIYIILASLVVVVMYIYQREDSQRGLIIMLIGIPVYLLFKKFSKTQEQ